VQVKKLKTAQQTVIVAAAKLADSPKKRLMVNEMNGCLQGCRRLRWMDDTDSLRQWQMQS